MGPEILLATAAGTALVIGASLYAGWASRAKIAAAVEEVLHGDLVDAEAKIRQLKEDAVRAREAAAATLDAARRRAEHDPDADPLGLGLLLPGGADLSNVTRREADEGDSGEDSA